MRRLIGRLMRRLRIRIRLMTRRLKLEVRDVDFWGENELNDGGMKIYWMSNIGFGISDIVKTKDGRFEICREHMDDNKNRAFTKKLLNALAEGLEVVD